MRLIVDDLADSLDIHLQKMDVSLVEKMNSFEGLDENIKQLNPDVLILEIQSLDQPTLTVIQQIQENSPLPIVVFAQEDAPGSVETAVQIGISSYIVGHARDSRLSVILNMAIQRFYKRQTVHSRLKQAEEKLTERKLIERAKGIVMQQMKLSEDEAYKHIRKKAMDNGQPLASIARKIIEVFNMLD